MTDGDDSDNNTLSALISIKYKANRKIMMIIAIIIITIKQYKNRKQKEQKKKETQQIRILSCGS